MSDSPRRIDVRVGSSTDGLAPVSFAERSLGAGAAQWAALAAIAFAAVAADQLTKYLVTSRLALDDAVHVAGPFWIHHVQNSGIAFGLFALGVAGVLVDGRPRLKSYKLEGGEELLFEPPPAPTSTLVPQAMDLVVPYEDEHLLVVDKHAGLVVHPAPGHTHGTLVHGLLAYDV